MNHGNIFSGASFRSALLALFMFLMVLLTLGGLFYDSFTSSLYRDVNDRAKSISLVLEDVFKTEGRKSLIESVLGLEKTPGALSHRAIGLFDLTGKKIAGNILRMPIELGWTTQDLNQPGVNPSGKYRMYSIKVGEDTLVVGQSTAEADLISEELLLALLISGFVVSIATFVVGYQSSMSVYRKLEILSDTLEVVASGNTDARVPVTRNLDQIDRIAKQINGHLDLLARQIETTKNTIAAIAHDLRAPLNRVFVLLQQLRMKADPDEADTMLEKAGGEIREIERIFDTILKISRIESSTSVNEFSKFKLSEVAAEMVETFEPVLEEKRQKLVLSVRDDHDPMITGDRRMLRQMLANLLENASRYSPEETRVFVVVSETDGFPTLRVEDKGPGIPAESRAAVVKPFHRLDASRATHGSGLGLALVNAIVSRHGATLEFEDNSPGLIVIITFKR